MWATCWLFSGLYSHGSGAQKLPRTFPRRKLFLCALLLSWGEAEGVILTSRSL